MKTISILVYRGKHGNEYWRVDTAKRLEAAFQQLFRHLDASDCYQDNEEGVTEARAGDAKAIKQLLMRHSEYEYEGWDIEEAVDPLCE